MAYWVAKPKAPPSGTTLLIMKEVCRTLNAGQ